MTTQNLTFREGEDWKIACSAVNSDGQAQALTSGVDLEFRMVNVDGTIVVDKGIGDDGVNITNAEAGAADIVITKAEQVAKNISVWGAYYYEIRLTVGEVSYNQMEGTVTVERSLFAPIIRSLLLGFRTRFAEITENDNVICLYLQDATDLVDADESWPTANAALAKMYLAAHFLMMRKKAVDQFKTGGVATGAIASIGAEGRTITFDTSRSSTTSTSNVGSREGLAQTYYGQEYLSLLRHNVRFIQRA